jgi:hypothetical protein
MRLRSDLGLTKSLLSLFQFSQSRSLCCRWHVGIVLNFLSSCLIKLLLGIFHVNLIAITTRNKKQAAKSYKKKTTAKQIFHGVSL